MSFGIGLGAFVEGFEKGARMRVGIDQYREQKKNKADLKAIDTEARTVFNSEVEAGTQKPEDFADFWKKYALPRRVNTLLGQGDVDGARRMQEWGESDAAIKGGKLFSSALLKAQTGDFAGALADVSEAGKIKGYNDSGVDVIGQTPLPAGADGVSPGFRIQMRDGSGRTFEQDVLNGDLPRIIATFGNPDAVFQASQAAKAKASEEAGKRKAEMEDYESKKRIDQRYKEPDNDFKKDYAAAAENRAKTVVSWSRKSPEDKDRLIREDLEAARRYAEENGQTLGAGAADSMAPGAAAAGAGVVSPAAAAGAPAMSPAQPGTAPAARRIVVDTKTGKPVSLAPPQQGPAQPAGIQRTPQGGPPVRGAAAAGTGPSGIGRGGPPVAPQMSDRDQLIYDAAAEIGSGGNPETIGMRLMNAGIAEDEWPDDLKAAIARRQAAPAMGVQ